MAIGRRSSRSSPRPSQRQLNRAEDRVRASEPPVVPPVRTTDATALIIRSQPLPCEVALLRAGFQPTKTTWASTRGPVAAWEEQYIVRVERDRVVANEQLTIENRPVPRQASAHYYNPDLTRATGSTYFY